MSKFVAAAAANVTPLMSTAGIKDAAVRNVIDSIVTAFEERSGFTSANSPDRFVTAGEFAGLAAEVVGRIFSNGIAGAVGSSSLPTSAEINRMIDALSDDIKQSLLYQLLEQPIPLINLDELRGRIAESIGGSLDRSRALIDEAFGEAKTLIANETRVRKEGDEESIRQIQGIGSRVGDAEGAIVTERDTRVSNEKAQAIVNEAISSRVGAIDGPTGRLAVAESAINTERETRASNEGAQAKFNEAVVTRFNGIDQPGGRLQQAEAAIVNDRLAQSKVNEASTKSLEAHTSRLNGLDQAGGRVAQVESGVANEVETRAQKDRAIAQAINTIWANMGGAEAVIQDGELAIVVPGTVQATKWQQVQASVIDPNTGVPVTTAIRQELNSYASSVNNTLNSTYTLRAQVSTGGPVLTATAVTAGSSGTTLMVRDLPPGITTGMFVYGLGLDSITRVMGYNDTTTVINGVSTTVKLIYLSTPLRAAAGGTYTITENKLLLGGFGLAAVGAPGGGSAGSTIDFGVRADRFFIGATADTPDAATQIGQGGSIPFMVLTSPQWVNGQLYPPGVYIKKAIVGAATIGTAEIADASIGMAKIISSIYSANYVPNASGWSISQNGGAEFNDVVIRRNTLVASGYLPRGEVVDGTYTIFQTYSNGKDSSYTVPVVLNYQPGEYIRGKTFYIETGFSDFDAVANSYAPGFYGRVGSPNNSTITPGHLQGNVYELAFEVVASPARTWGIVGSITPGQRVVLCVTPIVRVLQPFTQLIINDFEWALFRQR